MSDENIYAAPKAELCDADAAGRASLFFPTSPLKLAVLYFATLGAYPLYWFYKNWSIYKASSGESVTPILRAFFYVFFTHSLFNKIKDAAQQQGIEMPYGSGLLATIFVILALASNVLDRLSARTDEVGVVDFVGMVLMMVMVLPLLAIQRTVNRVNGDPAGALNSTFSGYNFIFMLLGLPLWLMVIVGLFDLDVSFVAQWL